jgi:hypothetical protein
LQSRRAKFENVGTELENSEQITGDKSRDLEYPFHRYVFPPTYRHKEHRDDALKRKRIEDLANALLVGGTKHDKRFRVKMNRSQELKC